MVQGEKGGWGWEKEGERGSSGAWGLWGRICGRGGFLKEGSRVGLTLTMLHTRGRIEAGDEACERQ